MNLSKKVCMLGAYGVGKTSLISRFVYSIFSEKYQSTLGVKIDRKAVDVDGVEIKLLLWDLHGDDELQPVSPTYLRGMSGYVLVIDGTRDETVQVAIDLQQLACKTVGDVPFVSLVNKCDLVDDWSVDAGRLEDLAQRGWTIHRTSAKSGDLVNESFELLARQILANHEAQ